MECLILLAADWHNTSLQRAIKEGLTSSSPMEYGFLHLAICNGIKLDAITSEASVVEAWETIFYFKCISFTHKEFNEFVD